jgi:hypothetical protein
VELVDCTESWRVQYIGVERPRGWRRSGGNLRAVAPRGWRRPMGNSRAAAPGAFAPKTVIVGWV